MKNEIYIISRVPWKLKGKICSYWQNLFYPSYMLKIMWQNLYIIILKIKFCNCLQRILPNSKLYCISKHKTDCGSILDIKSVHFLQFQRISYYKQNWRKLLIHKPIDFSYRYRLKSYCHSLETSKSVNRNLVPSPNTKNHLLSLSELADRK